MQTGHRSLYDPRPGYFHWSTRPLHVLIFLLPLVLFYEVGSVLYLANPDAGAIETIRAYRLLSGFFTLFGVSGLYLPGILLIVVLLLWHVLSGDKWTLRPSVLGWMLIEAMLWTMPLLVFGQMVFSAFESSGRAPSMVALAEAGPLTRLGKPGLATVAIGAGLYEELLFRMVAIALVHLVACDLLKLRETPGRVLAVVISAVVFALYHDVLTRAGTPDLPRMATYLFAGLYFGTLYVMRGFGVVAAVHAVYDLTVLVLLPR